MEKSILATGIVVGVLFGMTTGCGQTGLVRIVGVWPMNGGDLANSKEDVSVASLTALASDTIDSTPGLCANVDGICLDEPFAGHYAILRLANDYEPDDDNPQFGQIFILGFSMVLEPADDGAPELREQASAMQQVVRGGEVRNLVFPLVDPDMKAAFSAGNQRNHYRYSAVYTVQIEDREALSASVSVVIGPYNGCPEAYRPVAVCPIPADSAP